MYNEACAAKFKQSQGQSTCWFRAGIKHSLREAFEEVQRCKPNISPNEGFFRQLLVCSLLGKLGSERNFILICVCAVCRKRSVWFESTD